MAAVKMSSFPPHGKAKKKKKKKKTCRPYKIFKSHLDLMTHHLRASVFLNATRETFDSRVRKQRSRLQEQTSACYSLKEHDLVLPAKHRSSVAYKCTMHPFPRIGLTKFPNAKKEKGMMFSVSNLVLFVVGMNR